MTRDTIVQYLSESCPWQDSVLYFDSIDSTNTRAKILAVQGAPHGTVIAAGHQTGGRGRLGRHFHSPAGSGVYLSVILRPECTPDQLMHLTCAAAVAAVQAVEQVSGIRPGIKWTNDLVYGQKKLAGILTELSLAPSGKVAWAVVGIGINCCQADGDFPEEIAPIAGSLAQVSGREIDPSQVAAALIENLHAMDLALLTQKSATMDTYRKSCVTLGKEVSVVKADGLIRHGTALDIDSSGALVVAFRDGGTEIVNSGEVSIRGMYGYV